MFAGSEFTLINRYDLILLWRTHKFLSPNVKRFGVITSLTSWVARMEELVPPPYLVLSFLSTVWKATAIIAAGLTPYLVANIALAQILQRALT